MCLLYFRGNKSILLTCKFIIIIIIYYVFFIKPFIYLLTVYNV